MVLITFIPILAKRTDSREFVSEGIESPSTGRAFSMNCTTFGGGIAGCTFWRTSYYISSTRLWILLLKFIWAGAIAWIFTVRQTLILRSEDDNTPRPGFRKWLPLNVMANLCDPVVLHVRIFASFCSVWSALVRTSTVWRVVTWEWDGKCRTILCGTKD